MQLCEDRLPWNDGRATVRGLRGQLWSQTSTMLARRPPDHLITTKWQFKYFPLFFVCLFAVVTSCCLQRWYSMVSLTISQCSSAWLYWAVLYLKKRYALYSVNIAATLCSKLTFFVTYMIFVFKTEWWDAQTDGGVSGSLETNAGMKLFKLDAVILCC